MSCSRQWGTPVCEPGCKFTRSVHAVPSASIMTETRFRIFFYEITETCSFVNKRIEYNIIMKKLIHKMIAFVSMNRNGAVSVHDWHSHTRKRWVQNKKTHILHKEYYFARFFNGEKHPVSFSVVVQIPQRSASSRCHSTHCWYDVHVQSLSNDPVPTTTQRV